MVFQNVDLFIRWKGGGQNIHTNSWGIDSQHILVDIAYVMNTHCQKRVVLWWWNIIAISIFTCESARMGSE